MNPKRHVRLFDARHHDAARSPHPRRDSGHRRLTLERVEDRRLLSAVTNPIDVDAMLRPLGSTHPPDAMISGGFVDIAATLHTLSIQSTASEFRPRCPDGLDRTVLSSEVQGEIAPSREVLFEAAPSREVLGGGVSFSEVLGSSASDAKQIDLGPATVPPLLVVAPSDFPPETRTGGLIDLTRVVNEPVSLSAAIATSESPWGAGLADRNHASAFHVASPSPLAIDGTLGRSQAVDVAVFYGRIDAALPRAIGDRLSAPGVSPFAASGQPRQTSQRPVSWATGDNVGQSPADAAPASRTPLKPAGEKLGAAVTSAKETESSRAMPVSAAQSRAAAIRAAVPGDADSADASQARRAIFARLAETLYAADVPAFYVDKSRASETIPLLAIAIVARQTITWRCWQPLEPEATEEPLPGRRTRQFGKRIDG